MTPQPGYPSAMIEYGDIMMRAHREVMDGYLRLAEEFGIGIEFGDFCRPRILEDPAEYARRLAYARERILPLGLKRTFHTPFKGINPHSTDRDLRKRSRRLIRESLDTAGLLGCSLAVIHTAYDENNDSPEELDRAARDFIPFLEKLLDDTDLLLCLENIHDRNTRFMNRLVGPIDHPRLGVCMDAGHMSAFGELGYADWYAGWKGRIFHNHWHDNDGTRDAHGPLGSGTIPWPELAKLRKTFAPDSTIALEVPYEEGIRESLKTLSPFLTR